MTATSPTPEVSKRVTYIGALLTAAIMAALAALLIIVLLMGQELSAALTDIEQGPAAILAHIQLIVTLVVGPLLCAALAALAMWRAIWVTRVTRYMRIIQDYCNERLRRLVSLRARGGAPAGQ